MRAPSLEKCMKYTTMIRSGICPDCTQYVRKQLAYANAKRASYDR